MVRYCVIRIIDFFCISLLTQHVFISIWVEIFRARVSKKQAVHSNSIAKRMNQNAYVRHLSKNGLELIAAQCELVESTVTSGSGDEIASCTDLIEMQTMPLGEMAKAFHRICRQIGKVGSTATDNLYIKVRRDHLLSDAMQRILLLNPGEMKKRWRIVFIGEEGIDAGEMTLPSLIFICLCHTIK